MDGEIIVIAESIFKEYSAAMKDVVANFYTKCLHFRKQSLIPLLGVAAMMSSSAYASEKEIWFDAKGVPVLVKDKRTDKVRRPTVKELEAYVIKRQAAEKNVEAKQEISDPVERVDLEAKLRESTADTTSAPVITQPVVAEPEATIPNSLIPKVYTNKRSYVPQSSHFYSPYYQSSYPYIFQSTVPRFSRDGSYGPVRYYQPHYNHGYRGHYHRGCGNGFLLRYSRPGLSIKARF